MDSGWFDCISENITQNPKRAGKVEISCDSLQCKQTTNPIALDFNKQMTIPPANETQEVQKSTSRSTKYLFNLSFSDTPVYTHSGLKKRMSKPEKSDDVQVHILARSQAESAISHT